MISVCVGLSSERVKVTVTVLGLLQNPRKTRMLACAKLEHGSKSGQNCELR